MFPVSGRNLFCSRPTQSQPHSLFREKGRVPDIKVELFWVHYRLSCNVTADFIPLWRSRSFRKRNGHPNRERQSALISAKSESNFWFEKGTENTGRDNEIKQTAHCSIFHTMRLTNSGPQSPPLRNVKRTFPREVTDHPGFELLLMVLCVLYVFEMKRIGGTI